MICKKDTGCIRREIVKTKNNRLLFRSVCNVCKKNKSKLYKGGSIDIHGKILPLFITPHCQIVRLFVRKIKKTTNDKSLETHLMLRLHKLT